MLKKELEKSIGKEKQAEDAWKEEMDKVKNEYEEKV